MNRLTRYLLGLFAAEATALFSVAISILFLVECLRVVDIGSVRAQGLLSLMAEVVLAMPSVGTAFLYVCIAIGLARSLRTLQGTRELHILHASQRLPVLLGAIAIYAALGALLLLLVAHIVDPAATRERDQIRTRFAADLVGRSLVPNRFAELADGVTITIGARGAGGEITSFFADDRREPTRRTYISDSALISADDVGYALQLRNGTIQYRNPDGKFSEIGFERYDMALERLTGAADKGPDTTNVTSIAIVANAMADGWTEAGLNQLAERTVEGLRVIALCIFVAAIAAFPSGRRRASLVPIEIVVLGAAFFERVIHSYGSGSTPLGPTIGVTTLIAISALILAFRLRSMLWRPRGAPA